MGVHTSWPDDTDGDVFRILEERNFDFDSEQFIEFSIDFKSWPLNKDLQQKALSKLPDAKFIELDEAYQEEGLNSGYLSYTLKDKVTYELVKKEQKRLTSIFADIDGYCDSWQVNSPCGL